MDPPDDQQELVSEVERTLRVLRSLYGTDDGAFQQVFQPLLGLAQGGLVGERAQPAIARRALVELRREVLERETGRVKNQYLGRLGRASAMFALPALACAALARWAATFPLLTSAHGIVSAESVTIFGLLIAGCAAGVWVSFGARKVTLTFDELSVPESDHLAPITRLAFAELCTLTLALLFDQGVVEVHLGVFSTTAVLARPGAALVIGILAGFSEQVLGRQLAAQAGHLFARKES
ncbi:MAG: hypothetical protein HY059_07500 [Proteobacteria bacterium]|nr:hypothetical protein [Pseudomonadota bacterium]